MIFASLSLLVVAFASISNAQTEGTLFVDDLLEHKTVDHTWMEIGYANLVDTEWTTITTTVDALNPNDAREMSVFMSLPEYGGPTATEGWSMVVKMNGRAKRLSNNVYQFQARLVQPNDSYCPKLWWTPEPSPVINVGWLIVEEGVYNVSTSQLIFGSGNMTRDNTIPLLKDDTPVLYHAKYTMNYTTGCDIDDPDAVCEFAEKDTRFIYSSTRWAHLGASNQIQTSINKVPNDPSKELWMNTRVRNIFPDRISMMLAVHSVFVNDDNPSASENVGPDRYNFTLYPNYADIHTPEVVSYFVWENDLRLTCIEGLVMGTTIQFPITDSALRMEYVYDFEEIPGLFGMIGTLNSVGDTTSLRVFNRSITGANFITQEDQCTDEEQNHVTQEAAFAMVVGKARDLLGDTQCFIAYDIDSPTSVPSGEPSSVPTFAPSEGGCTYAIYLYDLFMDGWDNVELVVNNGDELLKFTTSCGSKKITFRSETCTWNAYMQTTDGAQPVTWWENYWRYEHIAQDSQPGDSGTVYIGDYDSTISVVRETVTFTDLANTRIEAKENKCEQCKIAPPLPAKGPFGPGFDANGQPIGDGVGDGNGNGNGDGTGGVGVADLSAGNVAPSPPGGVGIAPGDAGAPSGVLTITGVSAPFDSASAPGTNAYTVSYSLSVSALSSAVDSGGFYAGAEGVVGPSLHAFDVTALNNDNNLVGSFVVSEADMISWINGQVYVQVNTVNHPTGEIRAQAVLPADWVSAFTHSFGNGGVVDLSAGNVAPTPPDGVGVAPGDAGAPSGIFQVYGVSGAVDPNAAPGTNTFTVAYGLSVSGLSSAVDSAALYRGAAGFVGPSMKAFDVTGLTTDFFLKGTFLVSEADVINWINGEIYVQVNSANHVTGEIRAQAELPLDWVAYYNTYIAGDGSGADTDIAGDGFGSNDGKGAGAGAGKGPGAGKGKGAGAGKGPGKPVPVLIELFDDDGQGWYNNSGTWSYPTKVSSADNRRLMEMQPSVVDQVISVDTSLAVFPDILSYPSYVIMNAEKTKQLHVGSFCPKRKVERCEERLPPNGEFVFRVMGKDPEFDDSWKFCGVKGGVGEELQFEMKKGKCVPISITNAATLCSYNTQLSIAGTLTLAGVSTDFSEVDSKVLENELASMLVSTTVVAITSWNVNADGNMEVAFEATLLTEKHGVDGSIRSNVDTLVSTLQTNIESAFTSGAFMSSMETVLSEYPQSLVGISKATGASLTSFKIMHIQYIEASTAIAERTPASLPYAEAETEEAVVAEKKGMSAMVAVAGAVVVVAALAVAVRARHSSSQHTHEELPTDSEHVDNDSDNDRIPEFELGLEEISALEGSFFVSKKDKF